MRPSRSTLTTILMLALAGQAAAQEATTAEAPAADSKPVPARVVPGALTATMLDLVSRGDLTLAVGERGVILRSEDKGQNWKQIESPVDITLTGVTFSSDSDAWAVGHESTILHSKDAGKTWSVQRFEAASGNYYLDVTFFDPQNGYVLGANGELWQTTDGGANWNVTVLASDEFVQNHLFALAKNGDSRLIAAEKGALFMQRSPEDPTRWELLQSPYNGSFFGVLPLGDRFLAFGMSGRAFLGPAADGSWQAVETKTDQFLLAATLLDDGTALVGGRGGVLLRIDSQGQVVDRQVRRGQADILALGRDGDRAFIATSRGGVEGVPVSELFAKSSASQAPAAARR